MAEGKSVTTKIKLAGEYPAEYLRAFANILDMLDGIPAEIREEAWQAALDKVMRERKFPRPILVVDNG